MNFRSPKIKAFFTQANAKKDLESLQAKLIAENCELQDFTVGNRSDQRKPLTFKGKVLKGNVHGYKVTIGPKASWKGHEGTKFKLSPVMKRTRGLQVYHSTPSDKGAISIRYDSSTGNYTEIAAAAKLITEIPMNETKLPSGPHEIYAQNITYRDAFQNEHNLYTKPGKNIATTIYINKSPLLPPGNMDTEQQNPLVITNDAAVQAPERLQNRHGVTYWEVFDECIFPPCLRAGTLGPLKQSNLTASAPEQQVFNENQNSAKGKRVVNKTKVQLPSVQENSSTEQINDHRLQQGIQASVSALHPPTAGESSSALPWGADTSHALVDNHEARSARCSNRQAPHRGSS